MIVNARNEIGALTDAGARRLDALEALLAAGRAVRGVRASEVDVALLAELSGYPSVRYVAGPREDITLMASGVRLAVDEAVAAMAFLDSSADHDGSWSTRGAQAWHEAMQLAVGRAIERRAHATLTFTPALLERGDAFGVFVETLDLIGGLRRSGRLWVPTLDGLGSWWLQSAQR